MKEDKKNESRWKRLKKKMRFVAMDIDDFSEKWSVQVSPMNILSLIVALILIVSIGTSVLIAFTPLKELIPGFPDGMEKEQAIKNIVLLDEIKAQHKRNDKWAGNILTILNDEIPGDTSIIEQDSVQSTDTELRIIKSEEDSLLRAQIEEERQFALQSQNAAVGLGQNTMNVVNFFTPLEGEVSQGFNPAEGHMGVDVVAPEKEAIKSTLDGHVIFASWTSDAGHVIQVQHSNNLVSLYKHNSVLLKKVGEPVEAGEPIAIIGTSGMYSTGPHLHFELWQNGKPMDPQMLINF